MNGSLGINQPGAVNSGTLGVVAQPGAFRSGSLGRFQQPGAFNSGSLGRYRQPGAVNSGTLGRSLGEYFAAGMQGLGFTEPGARNDGVLGEYFSAGYNMNGLGASGCGCAGRPSAVSGLGTTVRVIAEPMKGLGRALGTLSLDTDTLFFTAIGAVGIYLVAKKK